MSEPQGIFHTLPITDGRSFAMNVVLRICHEVLSGHNPTLIILEGYHDDGWCVMVKFEDVEFGGRMTADTAEIFADRFDEITQPELGRHPIVGAILAALRDSIATVRSNPPTPAIPVNRLTALMGEPAGRA